MLKTLDACKKMQSHLNFVFMFNLIYVYHRILVILFFSNISPLGDADSVTSEFRTNILILFFIKKRKRCFILAKQQLVTNCLFKEFNLACLPDAICNQTGFKLKYTNFPNLICLEHNLFAISKLNLSLIKFLSDQFD